MPKANPLPALKNARAYLEDPDHWCKYVTQNVNGACCLIGALSFTPENRSVWEVLDWELAVNVLEAAIPKVKNPPNTALLRITNFNDAATTEHADVLVVLDKAIEKLERMNQGTGDVNG